VICTNLADLSPRVLELCKKYKIQISTSLDGPEDLHSYTRKHRDENYFKRLVKNIKLAQYELGADSVSAVLTISAPSLPRIKDIVNFYRSLSFHYISFRHITDIGFARKGAHYTFDQWFSAYKTGLDEVIRVNKEGFCMAEGITLLYLRKLLGSKKHIFVDQNNPNIMGLNALVVNYNGEIYLSDESRMLAEEGDTSLSLGLNVRRSPVTCEDIINSSLAKESITDSQLISSPICNTCAFQAFCGNDLVYNYNTIGKLTGYKPYSFICNRTKGVISHILELMANHETKSILESWVTKN
jgi:sulfatase maturation enzyme AslB (radical SAM superfamily)